MFDLLDLIVARGQEIFAGQLFEQPEGEAVELRWFAQYLPAKRATAAQGMDIPYARPRILGGKETGKAGQIVVRIVACIFVSPDTNSDGALGSGDDQPAKVRESLARLVHGLRNLGLNGDYSPYSLEGLDWWIGDDKGDQPHADFYYVTVDLAFIQESVLNNYTGA